MIFFKNLKLIPVILFAFIYSCNSVPEIKEPSDKIISESIAEKDISFSIFMNDSANKSSGFGYDILMNGQRYIHQSTVPAVSGNQYFQSETDAKIAASFVCFKIQNNIMPPTITPHELDSLGVNIK